MRRRVLSISVAVLLAACSASVEEEKGAIAAVLHAQYDNATVAAVDPIVVRGDYAVAGWTRTDAGGRALLHKDKGDWKVVVNAGEEVRDAQFLVQAGMPETEAKALANVLIAKERSLSDQTLAMLDRSTANR
jgi:hypothetical protein